MSNGTSDQLSTRPLIIEANGVFYMYVNAIPIGSAPTRDEADRQIAHFIYWLWQGVEQYLIKMSAERAMGGMQTTGRLRAIGRRRYP